MGTMIFIVLFFNRLFEKLLIKLYWQNSNTDNTLSTDMKLVANIPIFIQIKKYYLRLIKLGAIKPGEYLPSVREVSLQYRVNPNTVQKAFSLLIEEGYITPIVGKGNMVNEIQPSEEKEDKLTKMLHEIKEAGFNKKDILDALEEWED